MDFFQHQDNARRKTSYLVFYYILAVIFIMLGVYLAFAAVFIGVETQTGNSDVLKLWQPDLFTWVMGSTILIVVLGSIYKISQLAGGGKSVAEMLGGRLFNSSTLDMDERKILNVVEEMAIASGTPVPPVYMMDNEEGINAFAAGFSPGDAVIGVTRGCVHQLKRDELQGVIAHEFSHIMNGDMALNIKLMGVLHGILVIAILGYWTLRIGGHSSRGGSRDKGGAAAIAILGILLMVIGYIGVFFGKLIKSAVSRQREYLADASAVQFTRNPDGIAGALKRIGGFTSGSQLSSTHAEEMSHMFFSNGLKSSFADMMSTHPPLEDRIRRIDPSFKGDFQNIVRSRNSRQETASAGVSGFSSTGKKDYFVIEPDEAISSVGMPTTEHLDYAAALIASIPKDIAEAAREPYGARAIIYSLLLNEESNPMTYQMKRLEKHADPVVYSETIKMMTKVKAAGREVRIPLLDMALGALRQLSEGQFNTFMENVNHLIKADEQIDLFEYTLQRMIKRHLEPSFRKLKPPVVQYYDINGLSRDAASILSCLAHWGADSPAEAKTAFSNGLKRLHLKTKVELISQENCGLVLFDKALTNFDAASPGVKKLILDACISCVGADGKVTAEEAELLRAISDTMGCPMPPFLPGQSLEQAA